MLSGMLKSLGITKETREQDLKRELQLNMADDAAKLHALADVCHALYRILRNRGTENMPLFKSWLVRRVNGEDEEKLETIPVAELSLKEKIEAQIPAIKLETQRFNELEQELKTDGDKLKNTKELIQFGSKCRTVLINLELPLGDLKDAICEAITTGQIDISELRKMKAFDRETTPILTAAYVNVLLSRVGSSEKTIGLNELFEKLTKLLERVQEFYLQNIDAITNKKQPSVAVTETSKPVRPM